MKLAFKRGNKDNWVEREIIKRDEPYLYSHVELVFSDGVSFSSRAYASGSEHKQNGTAFIRSDFDPDYWDFIELPLSAAEEKLARDFCTDNDGEAYDFNGVSSFVLFLLHEDPNKWFCSEVCTAALQEAGYLKDLIPSKTSPNRLFTVAKADFHQ